MSKDLGAALRTLRKNSELTQQQIADVLHIDRSTYAYYESGTTEPDLKTVRKLAAMFNVNIACLIPFDDGKPPVKISDIAAESAPRSKPQGDEDVLDLKEPTIYALPKDEQNLLLWYRTLSDEQKKQLKGAVEDKE